MGIHYPSPSVILCGGLKVILFKLRTEIRWKLYYPTVVEPDKNVQVIE